MADTRKTTLRVARALMKRSSDNEIPVRRPVKICHYKICHDPSVPIGISYLQAIPVEIFLHICSYIDVSFLRNSVSKVCKRFENILSDQKYWQTSVRKLLKNPYPATHFSTVEFDWAEACVKLDKELRRWSSWSSNETMRHIWINYTPVRKILLMNNADLCVCGGMGRQLTLWNISEMNDCGYDTSPIEICRDAHKEWVSGLATDDLCDDSLLHTASGDGTIKSWDLSTALTCIETYKCNNAAFSVASCGSIILAGLISKVHLFDRRAGQEPIRSYAAHKDAVSILESHDNYVVSASYDRTLAVWDIRMGNLLQSNKRLPHCDQACPISLKWENSSMYVGDNKGSLHLFDVSNFDAIASYRLWGENPAAQVTCLTHNSGVIICCSAQSEVKFLFPSDPPEKFCTLLSCSPYITGVQYRNGILAICSHSWQLEDSCLEFWFPV